MTCFTFTCPIPPSVNEAYANVEKGGRIKSRAVKQWEKDACWFIKPPKKTMSTPITAIYRMTFKDNRRRDVANFEKVLTDFLVKRKVMVDDSLITTLILQKQVGECGPMGPMVQGYLTDDTTASEALILALNIMKVV